VQLVFVLDLDKESLCWATEHEKVGVSPASTSLPFDLRLCVDLLLIGDAVELFKPLRLEVANIRRYASCPASRIPA